ncbi:hypothetical protein BofuT4_uP113680.1 [Botrytis cinerea T4]|uniref:Uncharacterized protein n=1 Tax=Botryotinia fuckeliana (strain T4) TaxID=999810 RepID=G2Y5C4_BOTF4|nr:hypothetical protein BofuT4_uP113680.1 [Botrytis cinerea T4]
MKQQLASISHFPCPSTANAKLHLILSNPNNPAKKYKSSVFDSWDLSRIVM